MELKSIVFLAYALMCTVIEHITVYVQWHQHPSQFINSKNESSWRILYSKSNVICVPLRWSNLEECVPWPQLLPPALCMAIVAVTWDPFAYAVYSRRKCTFRLHILGEKPCLHLHFTCFWLRLLISHINFTFHRRA
jgi:hypothetical protein